MANGTEAQPSSSALVVRAASAAAAVSEVTTGAVMERLGLLEACGAAQTSCLAASSGARVAEESLSLEWRYTLARLRELGRRGYEFEKL